MISPSDSHPSGYCARPLVAAPVRGRHHLMYVSAPFQSTTPTFRRKVLFLVARLKRFLNSQVAAAIAQHEKGVVLLAQQRLDHGQPDRMRIYRGPIDQVFEATAKPRRRA
jgi:hypothetical protein